MAGSPAQPDSTLGVSIGTGLCWEMPGWRTTVELSSAFLMPSRCLGMLMAASAHSHGGCLGTSRSSLRLLNADKALGRSGNLRVGTKLPAPTFSVFLEQASSGIFYLGERIAKSQDKG